MDVIHSLEKFRQHRRLKKIFRKLGFDVYPFEKGHVYCPEKLVIKAIKLQDIEEVEPFGGLATEIISHNRTRLEHDRLYNLYQGIWNIRHLVTDETSMAEVGVYKGGSTYFIAAVSEQLLGIQPKIYAFDTFEGHSAVDIISELDAPHQPGKFSDTSYVQVQNYLSGFSNVILHKGRFQDSTAAIEGESFCFVHLDVDIYAATRDCLDFFAGALIVSGIIIVDDYGFRTCEGAKRAVDEFVDGRTDFIKMNLSTGQCMLIRMR